MQHEGPALEHVMQRIAATPPDFMAEPRIAGRGEVEVLAVVRDLLAGKGHTVEQAALQFLVGRDAKRNRNHLSIALLLSWLLADEKLRLERQAPSSVRVPFAKCWRKKLPMRPPTNGRASND